MQVLASDLSLGFMVALNIQQREIVMIHFSFSVIWLSPIKSVLLLPLDYFTQ